MIRACSDCGAGPLGKGNATGRCRLCALAINRASAKRHAWLTEGQRRACAVDPARREHMRTISRLAGDDPAVRAQRSRMAIERQAIRAAQSASYAPEVLARRGRSNTERKLAHIPAEYRGEYRNLVQVRHFTAAEATRIVLEQHERDMARFRRKVLVGA